MYLTRALRSLFLAIFTRALDWIQEDKTNDERELWKKVVHNIRHSCRHDRRSCAHQGLSRSLRYSSFHVLILKIGKREASVIYTGIQSFRRPVQCTAQFCANLKIRVAYEEQFSSLSPLEQIFGGKFGNLNCWDKTGKKFQIIYRVGRAYAYWSKWQIVSSVLMSKSCKLNFLWFH